MNPKKFQIFVSSTYRDLSAVRRSVMESIQRLLHFPVGMEQFSADDDEQWQIIQETIQQTDYYICIVGHRYGSLSKDGRSFTEKEWDYAKELGVPIMTFVRNRNAKTAPDDRETDPALAKKLDEFVAKVSADKMVDFWEESAELNTKVVTALFKAFSRKPRPGWIRSSSDEVAEALAKLSNENSSLRNEVEKLASQAAHTKPKITVLFNGVVELALDYLPDANIKLSTTPEPQPLEWAKIAEELKPFLKKEEVESYNDNLPPQSEIEENYSLIRAYERCEQTKLDLSVTVQNAGQAKARELYVDLIFPDSVLVMEKYDFEKIGPPDFRLPENPLEKAEAKLRESKRPKSYFESMTGLNPRLYESPSILRGLSPVLRTPLTSIARGRSLTANENKVTIWLKDLMHTRGVSFDELILIPKAPGQFEIRVSIISEELTVPEEFTLPLKISLSA